MYTEKEVLDLFRQSIHCSQIVAGAWAPRLGYDFDEVMRMAAPFGGGMFCGGTCGAVAGAILVIGMKYGYSRPGEWDADARCRRKAREFQEAFAERNGSVVCSALLEADTTTPAGLQAAFESGKVAEVCPGVVLDALSILEELIED
ncbi:C-GCAxxG-C-C family protein [Christensenellaceae bacterium OttesenSCG-928-K19]|nr:C-GCAxxG-C-C family protein [Christensenellaceae bacterium OttesenSCG-928-K19]